MFLLPSLTDQFRKIVQPIIQPIIQKKKRRFQKFLEPFFRFLVSPWRKIALLLTENLETLFLRVEGLQKIFRPIFRPRTPLPHQKNWR